MLADLEIEDEHGFKVINLSNLKLVFLPASTTSVVQPLDQGIIACAKAHYRRQLVQWVIAEADKPENAGKSLKELRPNFYQMMRWLNTAWKECVSPLTIRNCWHKAGILPEGWIAAPTGTRAQRAAAARRALNGEEPPQEAVQPAAQSAAQPAARSDAETAAGSAEQDELAMDADAPADAEAGTPKPDETEDAFEQLDAALQSLQACAQRHQSLLPHNDVMMPAQAFHELDGEREVFEELDDAAIVRMIQSDNVEGAVDSDEDEADDFVDVTTTKAQALQLASDLHEFALAQPQLFHASDLVALHSMRGALAKCVEGGKKQATLTDMFAARR